MDEKKTINDLIALDDSIGQYRFAWLVGICVYVLSHADSDDRQQTATDEHSQRHADRHHDQYPCTGENINFNSHFVYWYQKTSVTWNRYKLGCQYRNHI